MSDDGPVPPASGRARDLTRRSTRKRAAPDTGRHHHLGAAPEWMPVLGPDGRQVGRTRVSPLQLASRTRWQLDRLLETVEQQVRTAAADADYEAAAHHRDEAAAVRAELTRRDGATPSR